MEPIGKGFATDGVLISKWFKMGSRPIGKWFSIGREPTGNWLTSGREPIFDRQWFKIGWDSVTKRWLSAPLALEANVRGSMLGASHEVLLNCGKYSTCG